MTNAKAAALSIITGGGKWVEIAITADPLYQPGEWLREAIQSRPGGAQPGHTNPDAEPPSGATTQEGSAGVRLRGKTIRPRDKDHLKFVSKQPCVACGRQPSDPHHLRFAQPRALGRKVSDEFTVPVCRLHHRELHRHGDEAAWWTGIKIDPVPIALALWRSTHRDGAFNPAPAGSQLKVATSGNVSLKDRADPRRADFRAV